MIYTAAAALGKHHTENFKELLEKSMPDMLLVNQVNAIKIEEAIENSEFLEIFKED